MTATPGIAILPSPARVIVRAGGAVVADTRAALMLHEGQLPPVAYIPRGDVAIDRLERSATRSTCPHKGEASYFSLDGVDIAWSYETPIAAAAPIAGMLAFYPMRVDGIEIEG